MNDMDLLRRWGTELDPPGSAPPPALRVRVLNRQPALVPLRPAPRPRIAWSLAMTAGLAAVIAGGVFWAQVPHGARAPDRGSAAPVSAAQLLHNAAVAVDRRPDAAPRADQFVFTEKVSTGTIWKIDPDGSVTRTTIPTRLHHVWASVDGTREGLVKGRLTTDTDWRFTDVTPICRDGRMPMVDAHGKVIPGGYEPMQCRMVPAFIPELPTDADAMLTWLSTTVDAGRSGDPDRTSEVFYAALRLIEQYYLTADMKTALFEVLSRLPGVTVETDVVDLAGRHGVAVRAGSAPATPTSPDAPVSYQLIFDPATYTFLGTTYCAILRQGIVDDLGRQPS